MKIYLAAQFSRNAEMRDIRDLLQKHGHFVSSRWIDLELASEPRTLEDLNSRSSEFAHYAKADLSDIISSDIVLSFTSENYGGKGGRHVEFGFAIGLGKRLIIIGPRENVFHTLPNIEVYPDLTALINILNPPSVFAEDQHTG